MRLFIALSVPEAERARIQTALSPLRDCGYPIDWLEADEFRVPLKSLGDIRAESRTGVERAVARVAAATRSFTLVLKGVGAFPTLRRPEVIWLGADPTPALRCLKQDLEWGLSNHGLERETRAFLPHIVIGHASGVDGAGAFRGLDEQAQLLDLSIETRVHSVEIVRAQATRQGPKTSIHLSVPLRSSPQRGG
jgi:RNA 2',3'-cyclic 3'-phosphodiesterase